MAGTFALVVEIRVASTFREFLIHACEASTPRPVGMSDEDLVAAYINAYLVQIMKQQEATEAANSAMQASQIQIGTTGSLVEEEDGGGN